MKRPVAPDDFSPRRITATPRAGAGVFAFLAIAGVFLLAGCPGQLEGDFPPPGSSGSGNSSGTGGSGAGSGGMSGTDCDAPTMVFKARCSTGACHNNVLDPNVAGSSDPLSTLVSKTAVFDCVGMNYIDPGVKPPTGVLMKRLMGDDCGEKMPPAAEPQLTSDQLQCVTDWLTARL